MDDGGDLVNTLVTRAAGTGAGDYRRLRVDDDRGAQAPSDGGGGSLPFPVVAADASITRRMFDNRHGTGQSVIDGLLRSTNMLLAGQTVVVAGFGPCGSASPRTPGTRCAGHRD